MSDDLWHVRIAPDDVKQLTLEQLDDLFRLEVIEADTLVWQPGMTEWLPLSVVAGLDDEVAETEKVSIPVSAPPPRPLAPPKQLAQTSTSWPPRVGAPPPKPMNQTASSWPPPQNWSNPPRSAPAPVAWSNPPPKPSVSPYGSTVANPYASAANPYASTAANPVRSAPPPSAAPRPVVNPLASPVPSFAPPSAPLSTAPLARTQYSQRSSGGGWLVAVALAAGAAVTLYRNDLVHAAARSVGGETSYLQLEKALGGPGFGTPRAVEQMAAAAAVLTATVDTPAPASAPAATSISDTASASTGADTARPSETSTPSTTSTSAPAATTASNPTSAPATTSAPPKSVAPKSASAPVHVAHAAPSHAAPAPEKTDSMFATPKKGKKARGSDYDPLNGSL